MTESDLQRIERELGLTLPECYKRAVVPFQIPALAGNKDYQLWDDAEGLIALNQELRAGSRFRPAWPPYMYALGDPHGDELIAMDTRTPEGPVWWLDHGRVEHKDSFQSHPRFADWVEKYYVDLRSDLRSDDYDPDGTPAQLEAALNANHKRSCLGCCVFIVLVLVVIGLVAYFRR